jgi:hypothetical protein
MLESASRRSREEPFRMCVLPAPSEIPAGSTRMRDLP